MAQPILTPDNAPRTAKDFESVGAFQLFKLAEQLGLLETDEQKVGWSRKSHDDKVADVLRALPAADGHRASPETAASSKHGDELAARSGQGDERRGPGRPRGGGGARRTRDGQLPASENAGAQEVDRSGGLAAVSPMEAIFHRLTELERQTSNVDGRMTTTRSAVEGVARTLAGLEDLVQLGIVLVLMTLEERTGASRADVLGTAMSEVNQLPRLLEQLSNGPPDAESPNETWRAGPSTLEPPVTHARRGGSGGRGGREQGYEQAFQSNMQRRF